MNNWAKIGLILIFVGFIVLAGHSAIKKSLTYDEGCLEFGRRVWSGEFPRKHPGPMPVAALNALVFVWGGETNYRAPLSLFVARMVTVLFALLTGGLIFNWARKMYGLAGGFLALLLFFLSPTVIAHSRLVTSDIPATAGFAFSVFLFRKLLREGGWRNVCLCSLGAGISQLTKGSCLLIYPLFLILAVSRFFLNRQRDWWSSGGIMRGGGITLVLLFGGWLLLNLGFAFQGITFSPDSWLPQPYLKGLQLLKEKTITGAGFGYMYLAGELKKTGGWRDYYLWACLFKMPIPFLILLGLGGTTSIRSARRQQWSDNYIFLFVPILFIFLYMSLLVPVNLGIRYLLPIFPFLALLGGAFLARKNRLNSWVAGGLIFLQAGSLLSWHPHYLSYFNELLLDRKKTWLLLADSNLDWGQNDHYLAEYLRDHPPAKINPVEPRPGTVIVSANELVGVWDPEKFRWLRENFQPVNHVAYSWLIFEVREEKLIELGLIPPTVKP